MTAQQAITFTDSEVLRCPFPVYRQLRDASPVYRDPVTGMYVISRYDDCKAIAANATAFSNKTWDLAAGAASSPAEREIARLREEVVRRALGLGREEG